MSGSVLPIATEAPGLADMTSDPSLRTVRKMQLKEEVEEYTLQLRSLPQRKRGKAVPELLRSTITVDRVNCHLTSLLKTLQSFPISLGI